MFINNDTVILIYFPDISLHHEFWSVTSSAGNIFAICCMNDYDCDLWSIFIFVKENYYKSITRCFFYELLFLKKPFAGTGSFENYCNKDVSSLNPTFTTEVNSSISLHVVNLIICRIVNVR